MFGGLLARKREIIDCVDCRMRIDIILAFREHTRDEVDLQFSCNSIHGLSEFGSKGKNTLYAMFILLHSRLNQTHLGPL
jgi:hypothetical protein